MKKSFLENNKNLEILDNRFPFRIFSLEIFKVIIDDAFHNFYHIVGTASVILNILTMPDTSSPP